MMQTLVITSDKLMITLHQFPAAWDVISASCFCAKLETFLRWQMLPYRSVHSLSLKGAPKGKVPYIVLDGDTLGDSDLVIHHLSQRFDLNPFPALNDEQKAQARAIHYLCEEGVYRAMTYYRFIDDAGWEIIRRTFFSTIPALLLPALNWKVRRVVRQQLAAQGIGRHSAQDVARLGCRDISALSLMLGTKPYFLGHDLTLADITVFSVMANLLVPPFDNPLTRHARALSNLAQHTQRVRQRCFGISEPVAASA